MTEISNAHYENADETVVRAIIDGEQVSNIVMTVESYRQRQMQEWIDAGGVVAPYIKPVKIDPELNSIGTGKTAAQILGTEG